MTFFPSNFDFRGCIFAITYVTSNLGEPSTQKIDAAMASPNAEARRITRRVSHRTNRQAPAYCAPSGSPGDAPLAIMSGGDHHCGEGGAIDAWHLLSSSAAGAYFVLCCPS